MKAGLALLSNDRVQFGNVGLLRCSAFGLFLDCVLRCWQGPSCSAFNGLLVGVPGWLAW